VELETGKIYESRLGPDQVLGRVDLEDGKVYLGKLGPDEYLGRVHEDGKLSPPQKHCRDKVHREGCTDMASIAHGGAAFLLLVIPHFEERPTRRENPKTTAKARARPAET
jgi:hypothetical protein